MIVAVETNFILELAFQQREAEQAELILQLAEARQLELAIPACAILEAYENLAIQSRKRNKLYGELRDQIRQLARSRRFTGLEQTSRA
jgi:hypothetical protein